MTTRIDDPYLTLGVARGATTAQIKAAHRKLAKRFHPDRGAADARGFLAVQEAYKLLTDPLRRQEWDAAHAPPPARPARSAGPAPAQPTRRTQARSSRRTTGAGAAAQRHSAPTAPTLDFDVYDRSSGAAWSSAARAYFRRGDHELPGRGSFHHVGHMPLTAARARAAAAASARATAAAAAQVGGTDLRPQAGVAHHSHRRPARRGVIGRLIARLRGNG
jgi:curved DNA-binding protein CbpA